MVLRLLLLLVLLVPSTLSLAKTGSVDPSNSWLDASKAISWYDALLLPMEGRGFQDTPTSYSRIPARAMDQVSTQVRNLSSNTAGLCFRFVTDSTTITAAWDGGEGMNHMAPTGVAGLDLYRRVNNKWEFCGVGRPKTTWTTYTLSRNLQDKQKGPVEYLLYLPLYHKITKLLIGIDPQAELRPADPRPAAKSRPIVFYGTSITQGGCASRCGMCHTALLGRWLDREVINLGFSGSGKGELIMARLCAEIDAELFVVESLPNQEVSEVRDRMVPFVKTLHQAHPDTPILLVENLLLKRDNIQNKTLREAYEKLKRDGIHKLYLLPGEPQLAGEENGTVDGVHPTDLGYFRMAKVYLPVLKSMLLEGPSRNH